MAKGKATAAGRSQPVGTRRLRHCRGGAGAKSAARTWLGALTTTPRPWRRIRCGRGRAMAERTARCEDGHGAAARRRCGAVTSRPIILQQVSTPRRRLADSARLPPRRRAAAPQRRRTAAVGAAQPTKNFLVPSPKPRADGAAIRGMLQHPYRSTSRSATGGASGSPQRASSSIALRGQAWPGVAALPPAAHASPRRTRPLPTRARGTRPQPALDSRAVIVHGVILARETATQHSRAAAPWPGGLAR